VRDSLSIPQMAGTAVQYVTDDSICTVALAALQNAGTTSPNMPVKGYVWRLGATRWYVWQRVDGPSPRFRVASIFDSTFSTFYGRIID
jgi:hypothetical protein